VRNGDSATAISADPVGRRNPVGGGSPPLGAVSAECSERAPSTVVRVDLGPLQWALVAQAPGLQAPPTPPGLAGPFVRPLPGRFAVVRVPELPDPGLGTATLLYRRGQTLIYCLEHDITERAACVLSALAGPMLDLVLADAGQPEPQIMVSRIDHSLLPADYRHVASAEVRGGDIVFVVCSGLISAALADTLGLLCTAHARDLLQLGRPSQIGPPATAEDQLLRHGCLANPLVLDKCGWPLDHGSPARLCADANT
jgi:hypothetical protein